MGIYYISDKEARELFVVAYGKAGVKLRPVDVNVSIIKIPGKIKDKPIISVDLSEIDEKNTIIDCNVMTLKSLKKVDKKR